MHRRADIARRVDGERFSLAGEVAGVHLFPFALRNEPFAQRERAFGVEPGFHHRRVVVVVVGLFLVGCHRNNIRGIGSVYIRDRLSALRLDFIWGLPGIAVARINHVAGFAVAIVIDVGAILAGAAVRVLNRVLQACSHIGMHHVARFLELYGD